MNGHASSSNTRSVKFVNICSSPDWTAEPMLDGKPSHSTLALRGCVSCCSQHEYDYPITSVITVHKETDQVVNVVFAADFIDNELDLLLNLIPDGVNVYGMHPQFHELYNEFIEKNPDMAWVDDLEDFGVVLDGNLMVTHPDWGRRGIGLKATLMILEYFYNCGFEYMETETTNSYSGTMVSKAGFEVVAEKKWVDFKEFEGGKSGKVFDKPDEGYEHLLVDHPVASMSFTWLPKIFGPRDEKIQKWLDEKLSEDQDKEDTEVDVSKIVSRSHSNTSKL